MRKAKPTKTLEVDGSSLAANSVLTDVLVVGAGVAGMAAAVAVRKEGADVLLVDKGRAGFSGASFYPLNSSWGYQVVLPTDPRNSDENLAKEIERAAGPLAQSRITEILVEEAWPRLEDLLSWGVKLRTSGGVPIRTAGCFGEAKRAVMTRRQKRAFGDLARRLGVKDGWRAVRLSGDRHRCTGAVLANGHGRTIEVRAKAVILATGGAAGLFDRQLSDPALTGDGYGLADRIGARLAALEFFQIMLAFPGARRHRFFSNQAFLSECCLVDPESGARISFLNTQAAQDRSRHVPFSVTDQSFKIDLTVARLGSALAEFRDPPQRRVPIVHAVHAFSGGVLIDEWGRTSIPGLFAAGEAAGGIHGVDRLGGIMIPACLIFGRRAGLAAARLARSERHWPGCKSEDGQLMGKPASDRVETVMPRLRRVLTHHALILRSDTGLREALKTVHALEEELREGSRKDRKIGPVGWAVGNSIRSAARILQSASDRRESIGSHYRADYPPPH